MFFSFCDFRIGQQQKATCIALWQARFFTGTVEQRKAGATSNGFDIYKNGPIIHSPTSMYMNPHSCQETRIQHRKAQEIGEHDLSGFPAWISKNTFLFMSKVTCSSLSWFQLQRSTGSREEPDRFENTA